MKYSTVLLLAALLAVASACDAGAKACGNDCYSEDQYCCINGKLTQKQFCPASTPSSTSAAPATTSAQPSQSQSGNSGPDVASVHNDCESNCAPNNNTCCGCCGSDSFCSGNDISRRCCPQGAAFCGCISSRGFCSGSVYGSDTRKNGTDGFGACYDPSKGSCTYSPSPNLWVVCPNGYTACESSSFFSCCDDSTSVCTSNTYSSSYPVCSPKSTTSSSSVTPASSSSTTSAAATTSSFADTTSSAPVNPCGAGLSACGQACYPPDGSYCCKNGQLTQKSLCDQTPTPSTSENSTPAKTSSSQVATPSSAPATSSSSAAATSSAASNNCGAGLRSCGKACYPDDGSYCCVDGNLTQKQSCPAGAQ